MALAALCVLAVVLTLAQLVRSSQAASRSSAEQRFASGAVVRGQLTSALLSTSSAALRAAALKTAATPAALDRFVKASKVGYAAILSDEGDVLAVSSSTSRATARRLASHPAYVRQALSDRTWLSGLQGGADDFDRFFDLRTHRCRRFFRWEAGCH